MSISFQPLKHTYSGAASDCLGDDHPSQEGSQPEMKQNYSYTCTNTKRKKTYKKQKGNPAGKV